MERITTLDVTESLVRARSHFIITKQLRLVMIIENVSRQHSDTVSSLYYKKDWEMDMN